MFNFKFSTFVIYISITFNIIYSHIGDDHICEMRYLESINGLVYNALTTEGPFPATINDYINSTDLLNAGKAGQSGMTDDRDTFLNGVKINIKLNFYNVDSFQNATALNNADIFIWHCDVAGVYSSISSQGTLGQKWLRGVQSVDSTGSVTFNTIIPGWYTGRIVHFHLRVHLKSANTDSYIMTTQLFVPDDIVTKVATMTPYSNSKQSIIPKNQDNVYNSISSSLRDKMYLTITGDANIGYSASYNIGILSTGNENSNNGGPGRPGPKSNSERLSFRAFLFTLLIMILY